MSYPSGPQGPYPQDPHGQYPQGQYPQSPQGQYPQGEYRPQYPPAQPLASGGPSGSRSGSRRPLWLAAVAGFLAAAVVAAVLVVTGVMPGGDAADDVSTDSVSLPAKVASFQRFDQVKINQSARASTQVAHTKLANRKTADALSKAHNGAGADVQTYADDKLLTIFTVWAVRGYTPAPVIPYQDADYLGLAQPQQKIRKIGNVSCALFSKEAYPKDAKPPADSYIVQYCQRSEGQLTVTLMGGGANGFSSDPERVAHAVDTVWDGLS